MQQLRSSMFEKFLRLATVCAYVKFLDKRLDVSGQARDVIGHARQARDVVLQALGGGWGKRNLRKWENAWAPLPPGLFAATTSIVQSLYWTAYFDIFQIVVAVVQCFDTWPWMLRLTLKVIARWAIASEKANTTIIVRTKKRRPSMSLTSAKSQSANWRRHSAPGLRGTARRRCCFVRRGCRSSNCLERPRKVLTASELSDGCSFVGFIRTAVQQFAACNCSLLCIFVPYKPVSDGCDVPRVGLKSDMRTTMCFCILIQSEWFLLCFRSIFLLFSNYF